MFNTIGFYISNGNLNFQLNVSALDNGTTLIINSLHNLTNFKDKAKNAFVSVYNDWALKANNIRAIANSGVQKLYYLGVYNNSNLSQGQSQENEINLLNEKNEANGRFLLIGLNANAVPVMPSVRVFNNANISLKLRIKVEYYNYVNPETEGGMAGAFGPAIPNDNNLDGTIGPNERVHLNRHFLDYFPNQANSNNNEGGVFTVNLPSQSFWDINYDDRIRGGEVKIEFVKGSETWGQAEIQKFTFHIRGKNPTYLQVQNYLTNQNYLARFWFIMRKLRHESGSIGNFNGNNPTNNNYEFRHFDRVTNISQYNLRKNSDNGLPVFGAPRGYGMAQIDNLDDANETDVPNPPAVGDTIVVQITSGPAAGTRTVDHYRKIVATDQEVWHWKENIGRGVWFLETIKMNATISKINTIRNRVITWNNAHPTDLVVVPTPEYYDLIIYCWTASEIAEFANYNDLFDEGTPPNIVNQGNRELKSFFDAMLLKTYNGLGNPLRHFLEINSASSNPTIKPVLTIYNSTPQNPYYVRNLSNRSD